MWKRAIKGRQEGDAGTVMVDALIAVVIISLMAAICLTTLQISRRAATAAKADRQARLLVQTLMETTPRTPGVYTGKAGGITYAVTVTEHKTDSMRLCAVRAEAGQKGRNWRLEGTRWCDKEEPL